MISPITNKFARLRKTLASERAASIVEYIGMGAVIFALVSAIYITVWGNPQLGRAINEAMDRMALSFEPGGRISVPLLPSSVPPTINPPEIDRSEIDQSEPGLEQSMPNPSNLGVEDMRWVLGERYGDTYRFGNGEHNQVSINIGELSNEEVRAAYLLEYLKGSNAPLTTTQREELARFLYVSPEDLEEMKGREVYGLVNDDLLWNRQHLSYDYLIENKASVNLQILELKHMLQNGEINDSQYNECMEYISKVNEGTLGSTLGKRPFNIAVRLATGFPGQMPASHTFIGIDKGVIAEATDEGVVIKPAIAKLFKEEEGGYGEFLKDSGVRLQEIPGITAEQREEASRFAQRRAEKGTPYNYAGLILGISGDNPLGKPINFIGGSIVDSWKGRRISKNL